MIKKFVSALSLAVLAAGCGSPLEETWKSTCDNSTINTIKMDGENIDLTQSRFLDPECKSLASTTKQSGTYEIINSGKEGVLNQIAVVAGDSVEITLNTPEAVEQVNDQIEGFKARPVTPARDGASTQEKARTARSNETIKAIQGASKFVAGTATKLNRLQAEGLGVDTLVAFQQRTTSSFIVDNDHLETGILGREASTIYKKSEE